jgi:hypothetical protein
MENNTTTKKCPFCHTDIPLGAQKCPNCQSDLRPWAERHPVLTGILAVLIILLIASFIGSGSNQHQDAPPATPAPVTTQDNIAPATAPVSATTAPTTTTVQKTTSVSAKPAIPAVAATPKAWHTAFTYSGDSDTQTQPFALQGSEWRITYSCTTSAEAASDGVDGNFYGYIYSTDGTIANNFASFIDCPANNTSYVYSQPAGQYYLKTMSPNASYIVTIDDLY